MDNCVFFKRCVFEGRGLLVASVRTLYPITLDYIACMYSGPLILSAQFGEDWAKIEIALWKTCFLKM